MDIEALVGLLIPLAFIGVVGGLIALKMLKPYGDRILELIKEIQKDRHQALSQTRDLQQIHDRLDVLSERQEFLEALVESHLDTEELEGGKRRRLDRESAVGRGGGEAGGSASDTSDSPAPRTSASDSPGSEG